jgi:hypothetical protein
MISNIMQHLKNEELKDENLVRHMVLKSLKYYRKQFGTDYGQMVICCDSISYWRRQYFPYYKMHRRAERDESPIDWDVLHGIFDTLKKEFREYLPYKIVDVPGTEADDVIGVLTKHHYQKEPILILSSDKDFLQLQRYPGVAQYSPAAKRFIRTDNPETFLKEHIIRGDKGDGVPNILSDDDCILQKVRQSPISTRNVDRWLAQEDYRDFCVTERMRRNYIRNETLVDLNKVPDHLEKRVLDEFESCKRNPKDKLLPYFMKFNLREMTNNITDF